MARTLLLCRCVRGLDGARSSRENRQGMNTKNMGVIIIHTCDEIPLSHSHDPQTCRVILFGSAEDTQLNRSTNRRMVLYRTGRILVTCLIDEWRR